jgi:hypothetical protein
MSRDLWTQRSLRRLEFGRGGGNKTEILLAVGLGLVIVLAIALTVRGLIGTKPSGDGDVRQHFVCERCGHHLAVEPSEIPPGEPAYMEMGGAVLDCPNCGAEKSCYPAMQCPKCGTWFISQSQMAYFRAMQEGQPPDPQVRDVCPKCHLDVTEYYMNRPPKRKDR